MINKRLLKIVPNVMKKTIFSVFFQWLSLITNITITLVLCNFLSHCFIYHSFNKNLAIKTFVVIIIGIILRSIFTNFNIRISNYNAQNVKKVLREKIFNKLCNIGINYKNTVSTAEAVQVSIEGIDQLEIYFAQYIPQLFYSIISVVTLFILFTFFSLKVSLVFLICVPIIPLSIIGVQKFAKKLLSKYWTSYTGLGDTFLENIQGLTTLKIYGTDELKHKEMNKNAELFRVATMKVLIMQLNSISIMDAVAFGGAAVGIIMSLIELSNGNINFFEVITIILLSAEFFIPLRLLGSFFHVAMNGAAAVDKLFKILDVNVETKKDLTIDTNNIEIVIQNMSYSYDNQKDVLKNINLNIKNKGLISLVGSSGSGKSTLASILTGKLTNYTGSIKYNGYNLNTLSENNLSDLITFVSYNSTIFKGTVLENLKLANSNATEKDMLDALKKVNLLDFFENEQGLYTLIKEQGSNLSGGQKQRLAIARALLKNTPMYIFDEVTSNIDAESEKDIIEVIYELSKTKCVLMISHRLANCVNSENIIVLKNGVVLENGKHTNLIDNKSHYYTLFSNQQELENITKEVL